MENHLYLEYRRSKCSSKIEHERRNFFFLKDGTMVYPYESFNSYVDAIIDAVVNYGEDLDDLISLVFPETIDHPIIKKKILKIMNNETN